MRTTIFVAAMLVAGCGASAVTDGAATPERATNGAGLAASSAAPESASVEMDLARAAAEAPSAGVELQTAPWTEAPLVARNVPREMLSAWIAAENREWCALLAPAGVEGTRVRRSDYQGGWAVEFDKRGMPGMRPNGRACTDCGRGAFGIAGTALTVDEEDPMEAEERTLADGSRVLIEVSDDQEAAEGVVATLKIRGQDCVYQVWSFSGDQHLEQLLQDLRFVQ